MRYDYIHEFMLTQSDAEYRGVISRMTYARQTRYKPNWIWQKRVSENVVGKKQPKTKGKKKDNTKPDTNQSLDNEEVHIDQPLGSISEAQEFDIPMDSAGIEKLIQPKTKDKGKKQNTFEEVVSIESTEVNEDHGHAQEFDIIMDSTDIVGQPIVSIAEEIKQPKVKKPRSKKNTTVSSVLPDEEKVLVKKTKNKKQALAPEPAQEFDIVLEPSPPQEIDNKDIAESAQEFDIVLESEPQKIDIAESPILPSPSEYKQVTIKLPSQSRPNAKKQPKNKPIVGEEGDEEIGLIEPIKPKRVYTKKQPVEKQKGDGDNA
jgi:hypothetical protein